MKKNKSKSVLTKKTSETTRRSPILLPPSKDSQKITNPLLWIGLVILAILIGVWKLMLGGPMDPQTRTESVIKNFQETQKAFAEKRQQK